MKPIEELQFEYLTNLLSCNKRMTIREAIYRMTVLNEYEARRRLL